MTIVLNLSDDQNIKLKAIFEKASFLTTLSKLDIPKNFSNQTLIAYSNSFSDANAEDLCSIRDWFFDQIILVAKEIKCSASSLDFADFIFSSNTDLAEARIGKSYCFDIKNLDNEIKDLVDSKKMRLSPPHAISSDLRNMIARNCLVQLTIEYLHIRYMNVNEAIEAGEPLSDFLPESFVSSEEIKKSIVEILLDLLTYNHESTFYAKLYENIYSEKLFDTMKEILSEFYEKFYFWKNKSNVTFVNANLERVHRSGWKYAIEGLLEIDFSSVESPLIIDTYVDKTFHWNSRSNFFYKDAWIGFIHHTFVSVGNDYNCTKLFENPLFIKSLEVCECLIVLSTTLRDQIEEKLKEIGVCISVHSITHPTEFPSKGFCIDSYKSNSDKKVVQIGTWLRDMFGIYRLEIPSTSQPLQKCILEGYYSANYLPPTDLEKLLDSLTTKDCPDKTRYSGCIGTQYSGCIGTKCCCKTQYSGCVKTTSKYSGCVQKMSKCSQENVWLECLKNYVLLEQNAVQVIEKLDDADYDDLLTKNIVFLHLVDASAVNTLIECVARNTPILINRLPAVIEILGEDYPFYYEDFYSAAGKLTEKHIDQATKYLSKLDKRNLLLETFKTKFSEIVFHL